MSSPEKEYIPTPVRLQFGEFKLDIVDRQLWHNEKRIDVSTRYLDALILLVSEPSTLIEKDQFFEKVWSDVVVSDSALSQCIKELRRILGDDASNPRYIQTVPRHGYRFVCAVAPASQPLSRTTRASSTIAFDSIQNRSPWKDALTIWGIGSAGGAAAGLIGGLLYGYSLASSSSSVGTLSTLLVLIAINIMAGLTGATGVVGGWTAAGLLPSSSDLSRRLMGILGAALGGAFTGGLAKMLGMDAFNLFLGRAPENVTGGMEGAILGGTLALGMIIGVESGKRWSIPHERSAPIGAGILCSIAGLIMPFLGSHLMGGSLVSLAQSFDAARLQMQPLIHLLGGLTSDLIPQSILAGAEGLIFGSVVAVFLVRFAKQNP